MPTWCERFASRQPEAPDLPCFVIGEVAQAHDGSLGMAHAFIDAIADAGADAVKFQTHIAAAESTPREPWRVRFSEQDAIRMDYWKRMEFTPEQWAGLRTHATARGLAFLSSPFSIEAFELLDRLGVEAWKVASGELTTNPLLDRMLATGRPILLSTGLSPLSDIDAAVARIRRRRVPSVVMQCTSVYPCPAEKVGLNLLQTFRDRYECPVGLSDHSGTIFPSLAAVTLGAQVVEVHVTLSRQMFGPDVSSSVTSSMLRDLVDGVRFIERMQTHPVSKDAMAESLADVRSVFGKALVASTHLPKGTVLTTEHLAMKKPGTGIPAAELPSLIGARLMRDVARDEPLDRAFLEYTRE